MSTLCCDVILCVQGVGGGGVNIFQLQERIDRINRKKRRACTWVSTFVEVCIVLGVLREGEAVGDLQTVVHHQAQQDALNHLAALALFLVVFDNLQDHLYKKKT